MNNTPHIQPEDLTLHALQLLSVDEARAADAHLQGCSECQQEFGMAQSDLTIVALTAELETPSPAARERLLTQVAREKKVVPIDRAATDRAATDGERVVALQPKSGAGKLLPWLGWAVAAGVTFSAMSLYTERGHLQTTVADQSAQLRATTAQMATLSADAARARAIMDALTDSNAMRVTLNTTPAAKALPQGRATYVADKGTLLFIANNLEPLPLDKVYELWLIPANGTAPVPAGTFRPDGRGNASVVLTEFAKGLQAKAFGVTREAPGGATTPTMPILLVGA